MYQESYEDYIRSILGYPNYGSSNCYMENNYEEMPMEMATNNAQSTQLEGCYPEIYKVVYPMINKACMANTKPITEELIDELTNEIYLSIENDNEINVTINLTNEVGTTSNNRSVNTIANNRTNSINTVASTTTGKAQENRGENRQFRNRGLQDLIRILLIREFLGRPGHGGNRPPRPPMRPPFPPPHGGNLRPPFPPQGGPRPPIMPRDINELYEN